MVLRASQGEDDPMQLIILQLSSAIVILSFLFLLGFEIAVLKIVKFTYFDRASIVIQSAFTICILANALSQVLYGNEDNTSTAQNMLDLVNMITDIVIFFTLYYFIFEMRAVADIVMSQSMKEHEERKKMTSLYFGLYMSINTSLSVLFHLVSGIRMMDNEIYDNNVTWLELIGGIARLIYLALFMVIVIQWVQLVRFFTSKQIENARKTRQQRLSLFNRLVIGWIIALSAFVSINHATLISCGTYELLTPDGGSPEFRLLFNIFLYPINTLVIFLTASSLLYFTYYQASRLAKLKQEGLQDSHLQAALHYSPQMEGRKTEQSKKVLKTSSSSGTHGLLKGRLVTQSSLDNFPVVVSTSRISLPEEDQVDQMHRNVDNHSSINVDVPSQTILHKYQNRSVYDKETLPMQSCEDENSLLRTFLLKQIS
ncbi:hypothetical protein FGO68_gene8508 [Halteria grandinella]|uniref:Uncharacterized protein n=1 Tax=Halteria grandinella TaxID=5974 RepID=A0A8J8T1H2_HALGN|nr:hypothetical protein FGO68_gene8508 [Halteria grandinella]